MRVNEGQTFLDLYYKPGEVEYSTGTAKHFLFDGRGLDVRNSGQVSTPVEIADAMAAWVMEKKPSEILDPAAGFGHLLHACRRIEPEIKAVGIESDAKVFKIALETAPPKTKMILCDYLRSSPGLYQGIIANPPYVKSQRMAFSDTEWKYFDELLGTRFGRQTNLYALFLLKIWEDLAPQGRAAIIVPAEFLNANFGVAIKERLQSIKPRGIAVFASDVNIFDNTLTTSAVVFLEKSQSIELPFRGKCVRTAQHLVEFVSGLNKGISVQDDELDLQLLLSSEKWLNRIFSTSDPLKHSKSSPCKIGDFLKCSRGIATGANDYFCLRPSEIIDHGLSFDDFDLCITKAADVPDWLFDKAHSSALVKADKRCYLLNPRTLSPATTKYLELGVSLGVDKRHLPSKRPIWYLPERPKGPALLAPVFSRGQPRFVLNSAGTRNLTCFHGLHTKTGKESFAKVVWIYLNSSKGLESFGRVNRFYGNGLNKLEPKDVEQMHCPDFSLISKNALRELDKTIKGGLENSELSTKWFDAQLSKCMKAASLRK